MNIKIKSNTFFKLEKEIQLEPTSALLEFSRTIIWLGWRAEVLNELPRYPPPHLLTSDYIFDYILLLCVVIVEDKARRGKYQQSSGGF